MTRAEKFIKIFNEISDQLCKLCSKEKGTPFYELVDLASSKSMVIRTFKDQLKDYANLRNVIVHHHTFPEQIIAEPTEETLSKFQDILNKVVSPPKLYSKLKEKIDCFSPENKLQDALKYMKENDFSQIVVQSGKKLSLLTAEGIARWLEKQVTEDIISVGDAKIKDAIACDIPNSFRVLSKRSTIYDAQEVFSNSIREHNPRIFAIILTENGKDTERPLGIITPWDLLEDGRV